MTKKEIRILDDELAQIRTEDIPDNRNITGYGLVFDKESRDLGGFTESIDPKALDGIMQAQDITALYNHNEDRGILARYTNGKGTLKLEVDSTGLRYSFSAPKTSLGEEVYDGIRRGDIRTSSFAFQVGTDNWEKRDDGSFHRRITSFKKIYDVSPVIREAYPDTSVALRKLEEVRTELENHLKEVAEQEQAKKAQEELEAYFKSLDEKIKDL